MLLTTYQNAHEFLAKTEAELLKNETINSLMLGVCIGLKKYPERTRTAPYLATVEEGGLRSLQKSIIANFCSQTLHGKWALKQSKSMAGREAHEQRATRAEGNLPEKGVYETHESAILRKSFSWCVTGQCPMDLPSRGMSE